MAGACTVWFCVATSSTSSGDRSNCGTLTIQPSRCTLSDSERVRGLPMRIPVLIRHTS
ncbi:hypothetical protein PF005_g8510 [Phytophthora fragariae]|nr:hypothetical protein PF003_g32114 [Phytophthora fragariae]KAE8940364.1 hypothetical protein PF009_g9820 [Phytophthora fragariae]KAE9016211.1 hypothetical protein PF011_g7253 [Phytophthora fragariae]KAE9117185.1 hypothetical protein PF007_g9379 [Phytophthora fragariae]KAE9118407.1 hypothetical protein PF010_g8216 [Phytophthora fragariae]